MKKKMIWKLFKEGDVKYDELKKDQGKNCKLNRKCEKNNLNFEKDKILQRR